MFEVKGTHNNATVFTNNVDEKAHSQIVEMCNQEFMKDSTIRIMPDVHAGRGATIGTTMTIHDKVVPNLVGVDIGCGMETVRLKEKELDVVKLDRFIRKSIPSGFSIRKKAHVYAEQIPIDQLKAKNKINVERAKLSIGTLGGGNHFIEANQDDEGNLYIVIHSGSRNLGKQIAEYYQEVAYEELTNTVSQRNEIIAELKAMGRANEIESTLAKLPKMTTNKQLAYLVGESYENYLHDMRIVQKFATYNRKAMVDEILKELDLHVAEKFTTIHNYIDLDHMILRKGAISAQNNETVLIPINMRDGSIIATGKGNPNWNYSAPHGAGRLMSRSKAKSTFTLEEFKQEMEGIYSTSIHKSTLDEAPMAYKSIQEIIDNTEDTMTIQKVIKPIYNFKAH